MTNQVDNNNSQKTPPLIPPRLKLPLKSQETTNKIIQNPPAIPTPYSSGEFSTTKLNQQRVTRKISPRISQLKLNFEPGSDPATKVTLIRGKSEMIQRPPSEEFEKKEQKESLMPLSEKVQGKKSLKTQNVSHRRSTLEALDLPVSLSQSVEKVAKFAKAAVVKLAEEAGQDPKKAVKYLKKILSSQIIEKNTDPQALLRNVFKELNRSFFNNTLESKYLYSEIFPDLKVGVLHSSNHKKLAKLLGIKPSKGQKEILVLAQLLHSLKNLSDRLSLGEKEKTRSKTSEKDSLDKIQRNIFKWAKENLKKSDNFKSDLEGTIQNIRSEINSYIDEMIKPAIQKTTQSDPQLTHQTEIEQKMSQLIHTHTSNFALELGRLIGGNYIDVVQSPREVSLIEQLQSREMQQEIIKSFSGRNLRFTSIAEMESQVKSLLSRDLFSPTQSNHEKGGSYRIHLRDLLEEEARTRQLPLERFRILLNQLLPLSAERDHPQKVLEDLTKLQLSLLNPESEFKELSHLVESIQSSYKKFGKMEFELAQDYRAQVYDLMETLAKHLAIPEKELFTILSQFIPKTYQEPLKDDPQYVFKEFENFYNHLCKNYGDTQLGKLIPILRTSHQDFLKMVTTAIFMTSKVLFPSDIPYKIQPLDDWNDSQWKKTDFSFSEGAFKVVIERVGVLNTNPNIVLSQIIELNSDYSLKDWKPDVLLIMKRFSEGGKQAQESYDKVLEKMTLLTNAMGLKFQVID